MDWNNQDSKKLVQAVLALDTPDEARRFLRDLMTENEISEFAKRLRAAEMLTQKVPYSLIEQQTGLSSTTVARVSKWLNGSEGGYKSIFNKLNHHTHTSTRSGRGLS